MTEPSPTARDHPKPEHVDPARRAGNGARPRPPTPADLPAPAASPVSPAAVRSFRSQLTTGEDSVDPGTWAGSVPRVNGIVPRVRVGRSRWFNLLWLLPIGLVLLMVSVAAAQGLRQVPSVAGFISRYPGVVYPPGAQGDAGFSPWVNWAHFLNLFFIIFIIRSGVQILSDHPRLYWTRHSTPGRDWFRIQEPVPTDLLWTAKKDSISLPGQVGLPGIRHSIGLARWWHLGVDTLWLLNGLVFYVVLFSTGQWRHVIPTSWAVFPSAVSVAIQYLSLNWPVENGWVAYNGLQLIAYFVTVFGAAPLAVITGLGMSPALSTRFKPISRVFSIQVARSVHFLVLCYFLVFILIHVALVFMTGLLVNLNHMYAARNDEGWGGFWVFAASMVQRVGYALIGPVQRRFEHLDATPGQYTEKDISPYFWHNGQYPDSPDTPRCSTATSPTTGCGSTAWSPTRSSWTCSRCARCPVTSRSPSTSASRAGRALPAGAGSRCRPFSTWSNRRPRRNGWSSTPSATGRTRASTTTRIRSGRWAITSRCWPTT